MFSVCKEHPIKSIKTTLRGEADIKPYLWSLVTWQDKAIKVTYRSSSYIRWMREVYIVEQEQDWVQSVVLFRLALLPSSEVEKNKQRRSFSLNTTAERKLNRSFRGGSRTFFSHTRTRSPVPSPRMFDPWSTVFLFGWVAQRKAQQAW